MDEFNLGDPGMTQVQWLTEIYRSGNHDQIQEVERELDERLKEYVRARFGNERNISRLQSWVFAGLPTGVHYGRGVEKAILQYFGQQISIGSLRNDMRCTIETALRYQRIAHQRMSALHEAAMRALYPVFERVEALA